MKQITQSEAIAIAKKEQKAYFVATVDNKVVSEGTVPLCIFSCPNDDFPENTVYYVISLHSFDNDEHLYYAKEGSNSFFGDFESKMKVEFFHI